ncbi:MAG TPA: DUF2842 domain-containing protein [Allosphingosinicella sp.]|nr:DUF2842 domain-containing protein [Allosphingosinicella sp.]
MNEPTWRKPAGIFLILLLIAVWAAIVASVAGRLDGVPAPVQAIFYLIAGIVWVVPVRPVLVWMETGRWRAPPRS